MIFPPTLHKKIGDKFIQGVTIEAFVMISDRYEIKRLRVYADRTIAGDYLQYNLPIERLYKHVKSILPKIKKEDLKGMTGVSSDENMNAIPYDDFKYLVNNKFVTQNFHGKAYVESDLIGNYSIDVNSTIKNSEFLKSIEDLFCDLNNQPTSIRKFLNTLCEFLQSPKNKKELFRKKLHAAYLHVPKHQRKELYPLTIGLEGKTPIEDILYKRDNRLDDYDEFVKVYDDGYFEKRYRKI